jgi:hypothetical protein
MRDRMTPVCDGRRRPCRHAPGPAEPALDDQNVVEDGVEPAGVDHARQADDSPSPASVSCQTPATSESPSMLAAASDRSMTSRASRL